MIKFSKENFHPIIAFAVIGIINLFIGAIFQESICIHRRVIGLPCPACGMTRALSSFIRLDLVSAFWYHPLFFIPILICILPFFVKLSNRIILSFIGLFLVVWVIRMVWLFPYQIEPMVFDESGFIPLIFKAITNR